jgi:hypothetical protein
MSTFLMPTFNFEQSSSDLQQSFPEIFRSLIIIQGVFAGMAIGKMAEGTVVAGVKHSMALSIIGYTAFVLFG